MKLEIFTLRAGNYAVSTDPGLIRLTELEELLADLYGQDELSRSQLLRQLENSTILFGVFHVSAPRPWPLVGFCRVVSDLTRIAYIADVVIRHDYQHHGLGSLLMEAVQQHPDLARVRVQCLETENAHGLYRKHGFSSMQRPWIWMEKRQPGTPWK